MPDISATDSYHVDDEKGRLISIIKNWKCCFETMKKLEEIDVVIEIIDILMAHISEPLSHRIRKPLPSDGSSNKCYRNWKNC